VPDGGVGPPGSGAGGMQADDGGRSPTSGRFVPTAKLPRAMHQGGPKNPVHSWATPASVIALGKLSVVVGEGPKASSTGSETGAPSTPDAGSPD
jgi:hypothetical protein